MTRRDLLLAIAWLVLVLMLWRQGDQSATIHAEAATALKTATRLEAEVEELQREIESLKDNWDTQQQIDAGQDRRISEKQNRD